MNVPHRIDRPDDGLPPKSEIAARTRWETEADSLDAETGALAGRRLSALLIAGAAAQRRRAWPTLRLQLIDVTDRWASLSERAAAGDQRHRFARIALVLRLLLAAVDAEHEALCRGEDWTVLRPRVRRTQQHLIRTLAQKPSRFPGIR